MAAVSVTVTVLKGSSVARLLFMVMVVSSASGDHKLQMMVGLSVRMVSTLDRTVCPRKMVSGE